MERPRILLVEDNKLLRWWMMVDLFDAGFWVAAPDTMEEAIRWAETLSFDILFTDWRLPVGHDGFEMLERVRAKSPASIAVLMSAEMDDELARQAHAVGFQHVLTKPFRPADLVEMLQPALPAGALLPHRKEVVQ